MISKSLFFVSLMKLGACVTGAGADAVDTAAVADAVVVVTAAEVDDADETMALDDGNVDGQTDTDSPGTGNGQSWSIRYREEEERSRRLMSRHMN